MRVWVCVYICTTYKKGSVSQSVPFPPCPNFRDFTVLSRNGVTFADGTVPQGNENARAKDDPRQGGKVHKRTRRKREKDTERRGSIPGEF